MARRLLAIGASLGLLVGAAWAAIQVCPKCGYENWQGGAICDHCKAELPAVAKEAAPETAVNDIGYTLLESGKLEFLKPGVVEEEIKRAQAASATGDVEVARAFLRNATALDMLTNPAVKNDRGARIVELLKGMDKVLSGVARTCPVCNGTGKSTMRVVSLKGEESFQVVHGRHCQKCGGSGKITGAMTADERKFAAGRAVSQVSTLQKSRKYVPIGGAWIPMEIEAKLSTRQMVLLRRTAPPLCPTCLGSGRSNCLACQGAGEIKCTNPKCVEGMTQVAVVGSLTKTTITRTEKCKVCGGAGVIACATCTGAGSVVCKDCGGSGELPQCKKCSGQGFITCARCHGTGTQKNGVCSACGGEGIALCSSCNGDGRKK